MKKILIISVFILIAFFLLSNLALARELENNYPKILLPLPGGAESLSFNDIAEKENSLSFLILYFYTIGVMAVGLVALGAIIISSLKLLTAGANPSAVGEARRGLQNAILGIALLLGSWLILNTINPELVKIIVPSIEKSGGLSLNPPRVLEPSIGVDYETAKYGGIVVYEEAGFNGKSQVVLANVRSFKNNWVGENKIASIRYAPECEINLYEGDDFVGQSIKLRPGTAKSYDGITELDSAGIPTNPESGFAEFSDLADLDINGRGTWENDVNSLEILNPDECVGNALIAYEDIGLRGRQKIFLTNDSDLRDVTFAGGSASALSVNDKVSSIAFSRAPSGIEAELCKNTPDKEPCAVGVSVNTNLAGDTLEFLHDELSGVFISAKEEPLQNAQKALIIFEHKDFKGQHEIFITDDANTQIGNRGAVRNDGIGIGSLMIIGGLQVELFADENFNENGKVLTVTNDPSAGGLCASGIGECSSFVSSKGGVLYLREMKNILINEDGNSWEDDVSSIRIRNID